MNKKDEYFTQKNGGIKWQGHNYKRKQNNNKPTKRYINLYKERFKQNEKEQLIFMIYFKKMCKKYVYNQNIQNIQFKSK